MLLELSRGDVRGDVPGVRAGGSGPVVGHHPLLPVHQHDLIPAVAQCAGGRPQSRRPSTRRSPARCSDSWTPGPKDAGVSTAPRRSSPSARSRCASRSRTSWAASISITPIAPCSPGSSGRPVSASVAASGLVDKVLDWREAGPGKRPSGAQEPDYRAAGFAHAPRNGPFQSVEELKLVMGMTPELYRRRRAGTDGLFGPPVPRPAVRARPRRWRPFPA